MTLPIVIGVKLNSSSPSMEFAVDAPTAIWLSAIEPPMDPPLDAFTHAVVVPLFVELNTCPLEPAELLES